MRSPLAVRVLVSAALLCLLASPPALAEEEKGAAGGVDCRKAIDELCKDTRPGTPERRACVREKANQLPEGCRQAARRGGRSAVAKMMAACEGDIAKHCKDVRQGGGRIARCLQGVDSEQLSDACRDQVGAMGGRGGRPAPEEPPAE
jgi:hypothetical protein